MIDLEQRVKLALRAFDRRRRGDPELRWLPRLVAPGRPAVDIGANRGVYTYWLARCSERVHAFEPNPEVARNLAAAGLRNVVVHELALSDAAGEGVLFLPHHPRGGMNDPAATLEAGHLPGDGDPVRIRVATARLDDIDVGAVGFIKIDVEGHEERVLDGGWATIARHRPAVLVELEEDKSEGCLGRVAARFEAAGYRAQFLDGGRWHPLAALREVQRGPSGRAINNFLMVPDERPEPAAAPEG